MNAFAEVWTFPLASMAIIALYLLQLAWRPERRARHIHADLRAAWFDEISAQPGTEVLAVQTLRNSVMTATLIASSAALALMAAISQAAPSLHEAFGAGVPGPRATPRIVLELTLMALLCATVLLNMLAVRNYTHAGFVLGMPVNAPARQRWAGAGRLHLRSAGLLYGWGLRCMLLVAPILVSLVHAGAGTVSALLLTGALWRLEGSGAVSQ
ncbi:DUF599 family protein [Roseateles violae]|uniref:DUF599 family protein n=1 Tax=Roseateles violae TaxID=3058042 RepID=A0ABT8DK21_9BURK|nr:DUF599 family protein [Pelomonas sp. PFR6]MDN3918776.1 DUF599 family protein [Pelomonas sp. PFR6]